MSQSTELKESENLKAADFHWHDVITLVKDLAETNSWELPVRGEELIARAIALIEKSKPR